MGKYLLAISTKDAITRKEKQIKREIKTNQFQVFQNFMVFSQKTGGKVDRTLDTHAKGHEFEPEW